MRSPTPRRTVRSGLERLPAAGLMPRHQHSHAYATILLDGAYEQFAYAGRLRLRPGDVLIQPTLDCHADRMLSPGLTLLRLPWRAEASLGGVFRGRNVDEIRRLAGTDVEAAAALLADDLTGAAPLPPVADGWADQLAIDLALTPRLGIEGWAASHTLTREHVSRAFRASFGVPPAQFRAELNARTAWLKVVRTPEPLSAIAASLGYADQAHMTRAVKALTGAAPGHWRASHSFKTRSGPTATLGE
jgi:AraC-like DNA-binding protein